MIGKGKVASFSIQRTLSRNDRHELIGSMVTRKSAGTSAAISINARAVSQVDAESVARSLEGGPRAAWQRASYLLAMGGEEAAGFEVIEHAPIGRGPAYLGPRQRKGTFDRRFEVVDSVLAPSFSGVQP